MAEETNIILANRTDAQGTIEIVPEVLEVILGIAASQVDGVYQMRGTLGSSINAWFGRANHGKGVSVTVADDFGTQGCIGDARAVTRAIAVHDRSYFG